MHSSLVIGANGTIGSILFKRLQSQGIKVLGTTRRKDNAPENFYLDFEDTPEHWPALPQVDVAYICAAIGRLEPCEQDPAATRLINTERTVALAKRLIDAGIFTVYLSTNQVFDGTKPLRQANEVVCPVNEYGRQKATSEAQLSLLPYTAILRFSKVISEPFPLFEDWKKKLSAGQHINGYDDLRGSPLPISYVIDALMHIGQTKQSSISQLSGPQDVSYYDIATLFAQTMGVDSNLVDKTKAESNGIPKQFLPQYTTLINTGLSHITIPDMAKVVRDYLGKNPA